MTDKVALIKAEVERLMSCTMDEHLTFYSEAAESEYMALLRVKSFIDSLPKEPVSSDLEEASDKALDSDLRILESRVKDS